MNGHRTVTGRRLVATARRAPLTIAFTALALVAGIVTVSVVFVIGFLQLFHVIDTFEIFWFGPFFFIAYGISTFILNGGKQC